LPSIRRADPCRAPWRRGPSCSGRADMSSRRRLPRAGFAPWPIEARARSPRTRESASAAFEAASGRRLLCHGLAAALSLAIALTIVMPNRVRAQTSPAANLHYGMNTRIITPEVADKMAELGADIIRVPYGWDLIEGACKGCFDWTTTDAWRGEAKRT